MSEPKEPIVFWIDRNVPETYRASVRAGILEWNKAFERIGFKDAIVVKQQDQEGTIDTFDARHSTVRWFVATDAGFAIGPSTVDPRTGEILNAQVAIPESWSRQHRTFAVEQAPTAWPAFDAYKASLDAEGRLCTYASDALAEMEFGLDVLFERGEIEPGSRRGRGVRQRLPQGCRHARGGPHARAAAQLPRVHGLSAGEALGPGLEPRKRHRRAR